MSYQNDRHRIYTDDGLVVLVDTLLRIQQLTKDSGCCILDKVMRTLPRACDNWLFHNTVDWLIERNYVKVISDNGSRQDMVVAATDRVLPS